MMTTVVLLKLPHGEPMAYVAGEKSKNVRPFFATSEIPQAPGFIMVPYRYSPQTPGLWIDVRAQVPWAVFRDAVPHLFVEHAGTMPDWAQVTSPSVLRARYHDAFTACHRALTLGTVDKVVLARPEARGVKHPLDILALFEVACQRYPDATVCAVSDPTVGTWLICSPERLVRTRGLNLSTMSLAGTMRVPVGAPIPPWSEKNRHEQQIVTDYLLATLAPWTAAVEVEGPVTRRAGSLVHLASDVRVTLTHPDYVGVMDALHPTPALCGTPKAKAKALLDVAEGWTRTYYSGYFGTWSPDGVDLYVNLRSAQLFPDRICTFAGGGLVPASDEAQEWQETQAKMNTILSLLDSCHVYG